MTVFESSSGVKIDHKKKTASFRRFRALTVALLGLTAGSNLWRRFLYSLVPLRLKRVTSFSTYPTGRRWAADAGHRTTSLPSGVSSAVSKRAGRHSP